MVTVFASGSLSGSIAAEANDLPRAQLTLSIADHARHFSVNTCELHASTMVARLVRVHGAVSAAVGYGAFPTGATTIHAGFGSVLHTISTRWCGRARRARASAVGAFFRHVLDAVFAGRSETNLNHFVEFFSFVTLIGVHLFNAGITYASEPVGAFRHAALWVVVTRVKAFLCGTVIATAQEKQEEW